jgi:hypothetical protein
MFKNKSLMFDNWINIDLIYINDILNENGEIDSEFKVSISLNAIYISSLDVQNKVVSSASCDILML